MRRLARPLVLLPYFVGLVILILGGVYIVQRDETWESTASVILVPDPAKPADRTVLLEALDTSLTLGTHVELLSSRSLEEAAGASPDSVEARAVPESRVIDVTMTGSENEVQEDLATLIEVGTIRSKELGDLWTFHILEEPGPPSIAGPPTVALVVGTVVLAMLGAVAVFSAITRFPETRTGIGDTPVPDDDRGNGSGAYEGGPIERTPERVPGRR